MTARHPGHCKMLLNGESDTLIKTSRPGWDNRSRVTPHKCRHAQGCRGRQLKIGFEDYGVGFGVSRYRVTLLSAVPKSDHDFQAHLTRHPWFSRPHPCASLKPYLFAARKLRTRKERSILFSSSARPRWSPPSPRFARLRSLRGRGGTTDPRPSGLLPISCCPFLCA